MYASLDSEKRDIHQRLQIELSIGLSILMAGIAFFTLSLVKKKRKS